MYGTRFWHQNLWAGIERCPIPLCFLGMKAARKILAGHTTKFTRSSACSAPYTTARRRRIAHLSQPPLMRIWPTVKSTHARSPLPDFSRKSKKSALCAYTSQYSSPPRVHRIDLSPPYHGRRRYHEIGLDPANPLEGSIS